MKPTYIAEVFSSGTKDWQAISTYTVPRTFTQAKSDAEWCRIQDKGNPKSPTRVVRVDGTTKTVVWTSTEGMVK